MKLFSLLFGNSPVSAAANEDTSVPTKKTTLDTTMEEVTPETGAAVPDAPVTQHMPHISLNLDRLRKIFQTLSSLNENKTVDTDIDEEPLQMRRKYLGIFERFEKRFGTKSSSKPQKRSKISREKLLALLSRRNSGNEESKSMRKWARANLNRLSSSMRQVKSDSFIAKKLHKRKHRPSKKSDTKDEEIRLPCMKTKNRSSVAHSRALINTASQAAHRELVDHLQKNSSQHCLDDVDFRHYDYPFENLVFEGGGAKVHTYIGAIKVSTCSK